MADDVIHNDGDLAALRDQVEKLHRQYVAAARPSAIGQGRHMSADDREHRSDAVYGGRRGRAE